MKKVLSLLFVVIILSTLCVPVFSADTAKARLVDNARLLSEEEGVLLAEKLDEISERQGFDIVIVTENTIGEKTPMEYADDYYDYNGYRNDGCLLLVSMEYRDWWISTKGYGITALTDYGISYIGDEIVEDLSDGEYLDAFKNYAGLVDRFVTEAKNGTPYDVDHQPKSLRDIVFGVVISLVIGLIISLIISFSIKSNYKPVKLKSEANDYLVNGSLSLRESYDSFIYRHISRERKEDSSSNGGSSTHTSSSGSTHGGGGGKF